MRRTSVLMAAAMAEMGVRGGSLPTIRNSRGSTPNKYKRPHQGRRECERRIRNGMAGAYEHNARKCAERYAAKAAA